MTIEIQGLTRDRLLRARAAKLVGAALETLRVQPISATVRFFDDDGPKGGPAKRCAIDVRVPYRPEIRVERVAETPRVALDLAMATLERSLERYRERDRDNKRHPKKYFVAKRLSNGDIEAPGKPKRVRRRTAS